MTKLYENCQRMVSIAYANEMADACLSHNIDPMEVCEAASTKPFGYQPYTPSLGVGGHCIPVNPFYLLSNSQWPFLEMATRKMRSRPANIGDRIMAELMPRIPSQQPRILVVGVGFKKGQSVLSNAPGIDLIVHLLSTYDVYVEFADPLVPTSALPYVAKLEDLVAWNVSNIDDSFDAVVVAVAQDGLDLTILEQLRKAKVFNFSAALSWSSPSMLPEATTQPCGTPHLADLSSGLLSPVELEPVTPVATTLPRFVEKAMAEQTKELGSSIWEMEKNIMQVLYSEREVVVP